jgi:hypothetical protein
MAETGRLVDSVIGPRRPFTIDLRVTMMNCASSSQLASVDAIIDCFFTVPDEECFELRCCLNSKWCDTWSSKVTLCMQ